jgi:dephospho-CoA kinase
VIILLIGITGKSGSGKSTITKIFKELNENIKIVDIDKIGHDSYFDPIVRKKLIHYFGKEILNEDLSINRKTLSTIVFNDSAKMQQLYISTIEYMENSIDNLINSSTIVILDYALLPKLKHFNLCDIKILVTAPFSNRLKRVTTRDNISLEKYNEINSNSLNYIEDDFDFIIQNNFNLETLRKVIGEIYENYIVSRKF